MEQKNHEESKSMERPEESIRRFVKEFADIWNQHNAKTMASYFVNDGEFTNVIGEHASGRNEIEQMHIHPFKTILRDTIVTLKSMRSRWIHNKSIVVVDATWESTGNKTPEGQTLPIRYGLLTLIVGKDTDERWKIIVGHNVDYTSAYTQNDRKQISE